MWSSCDVNEAQTLSIWSVGRVSQRVKILDYISVKYVWFDTPVIFMCFVYGYICPASSVQLSTNRSNLPKFLLHFRTKLGWVGVSHQGLLSILDWTPRFLHNLISFEVILGSFSQDIQYLSIIISCTDDTTSEYLYSNHQPAQNNTMYENTKSDDGGCLKSRLTTLVVIVLVLLSLSLSITALVVIVSAPPKSPTESGMLVNIGLNNCSHKHCWKSAHCASSMSSWIFQDFQDLGSLFIPSMQSISIISLDVVYFIDYIRHAFMYITDISVHCLCRALIVLALALFFLEFNSTE